MFTADGGPCSYRPVRYMTFALDYSLAGLNPTAFHISNLVYHLLTCLCVFLVFKRWAAPAVALALATVWALHPVHTDAVAYISGRRDIVSTLLFLVAFLQLYPPNGIRLGPRRVVLGLVAFALATQAKEMAVTLPAIVVWAVVASHAGRMGAVIGHVRRYWLVYLLLFASGMLFVFHRAVLDPHTHMGGRWWGGSPESNFATVFSLYIRYFELIVWPVRLIGDYFPRTIPLVRSFADPMALAGVALYLALLALVVISLRRGWRATAFGVGWFLITMLPVSQIFPHHELFAEHYLYLPSIGLFAALIPALHWALSSRRWMRNAALAATCLLALVYTGRTAVRAAEFQSGLSFFEAAHARAPENARVTYNLGLTYLEAEDCDRATPLLLRAAGELRRESPMSRGNVVAFMNCAERTGQSRAVDALVGELLRRFPGDPLARAWLGRRLLEAGRLDEAVAHLDYAVAAEQGSDPDAVALLAMAYNRADRPAEALQALRRFPAENRGHCEEEVHALVGLGVSRYDEAFRRVQRCLADYPVSILLLEFRCALYFSSGQPERAEADLTRMEELGAPPETLSRLRALRRLRPPGSPADLPAADGSGQSSPGPGP